MKIILSRKGFDSSTGKVASPIFPSGEMLSLPIPEPAPSEHSHRYSEISAGETSLGNLVAELTGGRLGNADRAHLDPDLRQESVPRMPGWKPVFGQAGAAESHLQRCEVGKGDLFLFYGWFRPVEWADSRWRYVRDTPDLHVIFGWLQVELHIPVDRREDIPAWALAHPHCKPEKYSRLDSLYISRDYLALPGMSRQLPGGGAFGRFHQARVLTAPGRSRSNWLLPGWFHPEGRASCLTYHEKETRWQREGSNVLLRTAGRGQEFVLDSDHYPEALDWVRGMFDCG